MVHRKVVFEEGWSFIRGRKQCKPKHVSSGIVVLNVRWSLIRGVSQEGDYCNRMLTRFGIHMKYVLLVFLLRLPKYLVL